MLPKVNATLDYEAEMVVVVGKRARHLDVSNALSCIAGYSCADDGSIREFQVKTTQWDMGKNFDATGAFGSWMVTADDLPPGGEGLKIVSAQWHGHRARIPCRLGKGWTRSHAHGRYDGRAHPFHG